MRARVRVSSEYRTVKLPFPPLLDLLDFTTDQGDRTKTKRDGRKKKGKGKRRRQEAKRSVQWSQRLQNLSLGPSLSSSALAGLFSFDACKVFLAGILPRDPAGAPARTRPQQSGIIPLRLPQVFSYVYLVVSLPSPLLQLTPNAVLSSSRGYHCLCRSVAATAAMATTVVATAAAGGGAFRNLETLTKSRARWIFYA